MEKKSIDMFKNIMIMLLVVIGLFLFLFFNDKLEKIHEQTAKDKEKLNEQIAVLKLNLGEIEKKHKALLLDLENQDIVAKSQLLEKTDPELFLLVSHFRYYRDYFKELFEKVSWYQDNIQAYLNEYGLIMKAGINAASFLPVPYLEYICDGIDLMLDASMGIGQFAELLDETILILDDIEQMFNEYQKNKDEFYLLKIGENINLKLKINMQAINSGIVSTASLLESSIGVLNTIKDFNILINKKSSEIIEKVMFWKPDKERIVSGSGGNYEEISIESLLKNLSWQANSFKELTSKFEKMIEADKTSIEKISVYLYVNEEFLKKHKGAVEARVSEEKLFRDDVLQKKIDYNDTELQETPNYEEGDEQAKILKDIITGFYCACENDRVSEAMDFWVPRSRTEAKKKICENIMEFEVIDISNIRSDNNEGISCIALVEGRSKNEERKIWQMVICFEKFESRWKMTRWMDIKEVNSKPINLK